MHLNETNACQLARQRHANLGPLSRLNCGAHVCVRVRARMLPFRATRRTPRGWEALIFVVLRRWKRFARQRLRPTISRRRNTARSATRHSPARSWGQFSGRDRTKIRRRRFSLRSLTSASLNGCTISSTTVQRRRFAAHLKARMSSSRKGRSSLRAGAKLPAKT